MDFTYETVVACTSRRLRKLLEKDEGKTVHLCKASPCEAAGDYALHCGCFGPAVEEDLVDLQQLAETPIWDR